MNAGSVNSLVPKKEEEYEDLVSGIDLDPR
jgi:hypothetical protein